MLPPGISYSGLSLFEDGNPPPISIIFVLRPIFFAYSASSIIILVDFEYIFGSTLNVPEWLWIASKIKFFFFEIFISILFISPMSALGAVIGVSLSSLISYNYYKKSYYSEWKKGYFSYSSGVLGIIIGSYLFYSPIYFLIYIMSIIFAHY